MSVGAITKDLNLSFPCIKCGSKIESHVFEIVLAEEKMFGSIEKKMVSYWQNENFVEAKKVTCSACGTVQVFSCIFALMRDND